MPKQPKYSNCVSIVSSNASTAKKKMRKLRLQGMIELKKNDVIICYGCKMKFHSINPYSNHLFSCLDNGYRCMKCNDIFNTYKKLLYHTKKEH